ncbi:MAG: hypothetical protein RR895_08755, partial [Hydrogenoanaerobacterium sp.]
MKRLWGSSVFLVSALLCVSLASLCGHIAGRSSATAVQSTAAVQTIKLPIVMYHHVLKEQARLSKYTVSLASLCGHIAGRSSATAVQSTAAVQT